MSVVVVGCLRIGVSSPSFAFCVYSVPLSDQALTVARCAFGSMRARIRINAKAQSRFNCVGRTIVGLGFIVRKSRVRPCRFPVALQMQWHVCWRSKPGSPRCLDIELWFVALSFQSLLQPTGFGTRLFLNLGSHVRTEGVKNQVDVCLPRLGPVP